MAIVCELRVDVCPHLRVIDYLIATKEMGAVSIDQIIKYCEVDFLREENPHVEILIPNDKQLRHRITVFSFQLVAVWLQQTDVAVWPRWREGQPIP